MSTPRRITLTIPTLTSGGAERVLTTMSTFWAEQGRAVTVVTLAPESEPPFYEMHPLVERVGLDTMGAALTPVHAVVNNAGRLRALRNAIRKSRPDVVISFLDTMNVLTLLATRGTGLPVIVTEHTDPNLAKRHLVWSRLRTMLYPRAARVVVLSESSKSFFPPRLGDRISIIPNPIVVTAALAAPERDGRKRVAALGRFGPEKGFDTLISAFATVASEFPEWDLVIWGDGPLRTNLERLIVDLGMTGRIRLPGRTSTPHDELRSADLYALSSRREGFPMALAEAMACGLPAVAFDLPSGPRDIIRDGLDGLLVPGGDQAALSSGMASLMRDDERRAAYAHRAPDVLERFGVERVMEIWDDLFVKVLAVR